MSDSIEQAAEILDINTSSDYLADLSTDEVKSKFREKVKTVHPDKEQGSEEEFKEVKEAKDKLLDFVGSSYQDTYNTDESNKKSVNTSRKTSTHTSKSSTNTTRTHTSNTKKNTVSDQSTPTESNSESTNSTQSKTTSINEQNNTETPAETIPETFINILSSLTVKLQLLYIFISISVIILLGQFTSIIYEVSYISTIASLPISVIYYSLFVVPIVLLLDIHYHETKYEQLLEDIPDNIEMNIQYKYSIVTKIVLVVSTFGGFSELIISYTTTPSNIILLIQVCIVILYQILKRRPPDEIKYRQNT